ncbi:hypothetical protein HQ535_12910 [bacterium]|nr:hypothetical protein [bacterium]
MTTMARNAMKAATPNVTPVAPSDAPMMIITTTKKAVTMKATYPVWVWRYSIPESYPGGARGLPPAPADVGLGLISVGVVASPIPP